MLSAPQIYRSLIRRRSFFQRPVAFPVAAGDKVSASTYNMLIASRRPVVLHYACSI